VDTIPNNADEPLVVHLVIGLRGSLYRAEARRAAAAFRKLAERRNVIIAIGLAGWDLDERDVPDIPEAAEFVRKWARFARVDTLDLAMASPLVRDSVGVLGACGALRDVDPADVTRIGPPSTAKH
jgi:hypothetical protein